ncbi:MAG: hypothetical protein DA408_11190 [Bacteroidetes bacterium]|nr:MAG: hypothetical protein C7N36_15595 [Bacteroidota bacterium]PTM12332.1 MAG: hypothetical protein DA408_11190 [Bacteroidota bacterium]
MSKTPSRRLYNLVQSLSGPEKRYFKVATRTDGESKYLHLFLAIEEQAVFDEKLLQQAVYGDEPIQGKKFSELKAYLYNLVLKHLQQYDEQTSVDFQLKSLLLDVRSLYRRWLLTDCRYVLKRAKKLAYQYERYGDVLAVISWEKQLAYASANIDFLDDNLARLRQEEETCLANMANIKAYQALFYELYTLMRKNTRNTPTWKEELETVINHPLLAAESQCQTFHSRVLFYRIHSILRHQSRQLDEFYHYGKKLLQVMESEPVLLQEDVSHYIAALSNFATSCGYLKAYDEMQECLQKLKKVNPITLDDAQKIHSQYYANYFALCINTGNFAEGLRLLKKHFKEAERLDKRLFERNSFLFQYFYIYFGANDFSQALTYLNQWLDLPHTVEQQDLQHLAHLLNLVVHFEMGNSILLSSLLRSTQRNLQKRGRFNAFEQVFWQCLRQVNQLPGQREQQPVFQQCWQKIKALELSASDRSMLRFFDFESWLESKASRKDFATVIQLKAAAP